MKTIREWLGKIKNKLKDITKKLNSLGKYRQLFNYKLVFLLITAIAIPVAVVFSQYPQILTSFAKPPKQPWGLIGENCGPGDICKTLQGDVRCYAKDASSVRKCTRLDLACDKGKNTPCCLVGALCPKSGPNIVCDIPPIVFENNEKYKNPWDTGMCTSISGECGERGQDCCSNPGAPERCPGKSSATSDDLTCIFIENSLTKSQCGDLNQFINVMPPNTPINYNPLTVVLPTGSSNYNPLVNIGVSLISNISGLDYRYQIDCTNNGSYDYDFTSNNPQSEMVSCTYGHPNTYTVSGKITYDNNALYTLTKQLVIITPTPKLTVIPTKTPTPRPTRTPTPKLSKTPTPNPTSAPTCNGFCLPNGEDCYQTGSGTCQSGKFCCKTIDAPTTTPTPRPTNTPVPPTKAPNGTACSSGSQCTSGICKTCQGDTQGYCRPNGYICPL